jgi:hypothetical protein
VTGSGADVDSPISRPTGPTARAGNWIGGVSVGVSRPAATRGSHALVASTLDLGWALLAGVLGRWLRRHPAVLRRQRFVTAPIYLALAGYAAAS